MQLLYHCNVGPPFLEAGQPGLAPDPGDVAADAAGRRGDRHVRDLRPADAGFAEQVYCYELLADAAGT